MRAHLAICVEAANAGSDHHGTGQRRKPASHVDNTAARKVDGTNVEQKVVFVCEGRGPA